MLGLIIFLITVGFIGLLGYIIVLIGANKVEPIPPYQANPKEDIPENWPFPHNKP